MAKKTVGYVEMEWTCKRCGTVNKGTQKTCSNCGAAMEAKEQFEAPKQQTLITDEEALAKAKQGPDVHCPFCGTRNVAGAQVCTQCGGDLKDAEKRQTGQVVGAYSTAPAADIICPSCNTPNPAGNQRCKNCGGSLAVREPEPAKPAAVSQPPTKVNPAILIAGIAILVVVCVGAAILMMGLRTKEQVSTVQSVQWIRSVEIAEQQPVSRQDWEDQIPSGADLGTCEKRYRETQLEPAPGAEEVCGTAYIEDQGSGIGKVVQDCEYRIYDDWCTYTQMDWVVVQSPTMQGTDLNPKWPALSLDQGQREGNRSETYTVIFDSNGERYTYSVDSPEEFAQFTPGSQWVLKVNSFGSVTDVQAR